MAYVDRKTKTDMEAHAKVVVLAASCLETADSMLEFQVSVIGRPASLIPVVSLGRICATIFMVVRVTGACPNSSVNPRLLITSQIPRLLRCHVGKILKTRVRRSLSGAMPCMFTAVVGTSRTIIVGSMALEPNISASSKRYFSRSHQLADPSSVSTESDQFCGHRS